MAYGSYSQRAFGDFNFIIAIDGIGYVRASDGAIGGTLFTTQSIQDVTSTYYRCCMSEPPSLPSSSAPLHGGYGAYGSASFLLSDGKDPNDSDNDAYFTDLFANCKTQAVGRLTDNITAAAVGGTGITAGPNATFAAGAQYVHVGGETMYCSGYAAGTFTVVTRGALGTTAQTHKKEHEVTDHIVNWYGRGVTIYGQYRDATNAAATLNDYRVLFRGVIRHVAVDSSGMRWEVSAASLLSLLDTNLPTAKEADSTTDWEGGPAVLQSQLLADGLSVSLDSTQGIQANSHIRIDDELMLVGSVSNTTLEIDTPGGSGARARCGTIAADHAEGAEVREVFLADADDDYSNFWRDASTDTPVDHPLAIFLCVLQSGGGGSHVPGGAPSTFGSNGDYDCLPEWAGLNIPEASIDVTGIERLMFEDLPEYRMQGYIWCWETSPQNALRKLSADLIEPLGCVLTMQDGKIAVILPQAPDPGATTTTVDSSVWSQRDRPTFDQALENTLNQAEVHYDYDLSQDRFKKIKIVRDWPTIQRVPNAGNVLKFEIRAPDASSSQRGLYFNRLLGLIGTFVPPPPMISVTVPWSYHDIEVGDVVAYTDTVTPNPRTGTRGYTSENMQVVGKTYNSRQHKVSLQMLYQRGASQIGRVGPCARIASISSNVYTCDANEFTSADLGDVDVGQFASTDRVIVCYSLSNVGDDSSERLSAISTTIKTVSSVDTGANTITLNSAWGAGEAAGDFIMLATWDDSQTSHMEETVFMADATEGLGSTPDPPYGWHLV